MGTDDEDWIVTAALGLVGGDENKLRGLLKFIVIGRDIRLAGTTRKSLQR